MKKILKNLLILCSAVVAIPITIVGWSILKDNFMDYNRTIICKLGEYEFYVPKGYLRYGPAVKGCHPQFNELLFDAFLPDVTKNPHDVVKGMHISEYAPLTMSIAINVNGHYKNNQKVYESDKAFLKPINNSKNFFESIKEQEKFLHDQEYRQFFYLSASGKLHLISCHNASNVDEVEHIKCEGLFDGDKNIRTSYRYQSNTFIPNIDLSEQMETLIKKLLTKTQ